MLSFKDSLNYFVKSSHFTYNCVFVDKHELIKNYGVFDKAGKVLKINKIGRNIFPKMDFIDYNLYLLCVRQIIADFAEFLNAKKHVSRGVIVSEARGVVEDLNLRDAFNRIYYNCVGKFSPSEIRNIILDMFIVPKRQNNIGTQLADLVLYSTYDAKVPNHVVRGDHVISFDKSLKDKLKKLMAIP